MTRRMIDAPDAPSSSFFAQGVEVPAAARLLILSGQTPTAGDWVAPPDFNAQARLAWRNLFAQLAAADMGPQHLVKVTIFLADRAHLPASRDIYDDILRDHRIAVSTIITGLVDPAWFIEIEAIAAA